MSIRLRIALLSTVLMAVLLFAVGSGVYWTLQRSLKMEIDKRLNNVYSGIVSDLTPVVDRNLTLVGYRLPRMDPFASPGLYIQVIGPDGKIVDRSVDLKQNPLTVSDEVLETNSRGQSDTYRSTHDNIPIEILSAPVMDSNGNYYGAVQVAEPLSPMLQTLGKLRIFLILGVGFGLLATAAGSYWLAGRSLRPLSKITTTAREIGHEGNLSQRIEPPPTRDEVGQLAQTFNEMLERLEETFAAERRFVSDASHELRTPLTALRGNAEILLRQIDIGPPDPIDLREGLTDIRDEAERMGRLVHHLLTLARADVGWRPDLELVHLDQVVADVARVASPLAGDHQFASRIDGEVDIMGNVDQLKQLLLILLDNAFTYAPSGGLVELAVHRAESDAEIIVSDNGPGIPPEQLERIFDRFYRGQVAREHRTSGAGLGLAIARWIVACHNGSIQAESGVNQGTRITVRIPQTVDKQDVSSKRQSPLPSYREPALPVGDD